MLIYLHISYFFTSFIFLLAEYLTHLELSEERERQELSATEEFNRGGQKSSIVPQLLEKLSRPNQSPLYYCRGLELLSKAITDCECTKGTSSPIPLIGSLSHVVRLPAQLVDTGSSSSKAYRVRMKAKRERRSTVGSKERREKAGADFTFRTGRKVKHQSKKSVCCR